jgi:hypothetical protein
VVVAPHPLNDLNKAQLQEFARAAYPLIIEQLTGQGSLELNARVNFVHPAKRGAQAQAAVRGEQGK